ncbi:MULTISPECIES: matrixin family metalloprotease [unclassified Imperialibacter]|uniref:matrixin family metalloprotease n=1 Tax=unclassified Imperialibacter TaxID=2629706 RepID=UPI001251C205|nr:MULTISPECIES: matrixin family metalloprotease [unclassified Imperialibacter]CAD5276902.1 conserved hypothetical protein [Imperialibacter sp. 89]CAD5295249.1 conserved hypothetical protein [Imperialibacter sp. 75]VVT29163.1 conserved hypothetical protein [Imperialibacter sp. EC-SDR9]
MKRIHLLTCFLLLFGVSCNNEDEEKSYRSCNGLLSNCAGSGEGAFCTFGFKWGSSNPFSTAGLEVNGPSEAGGEITYRFYEKGEVFNTHAQVDLLSASFDQITICDPKDQIRQVLLAWESEANLSFREVSGSTSGDLRFIVAHIQQGGVGYPAFTDDLCGTLAGQVVIGLPTRNTCEGFRNLVLHEIGHTLGLGHVSTDNVMNPGIQDITELMPGDIEGIQSIYGTR